MDVVIVVVGSLIVVGALMYAEMPASFSMMPSGAAPVSARATLTNGGG